jgi:hypothetical protein
LPEFWIFDFHNQVDSPVDIVKLEELPERAGAFRFMELADHPPIFRNNQVEITNKTARHMGELYKHLVERGRRSNFRDFNEQQAQQFILQCVLAMFAEDRGLLPQDLFVSCVQDCIQGKGSTYDILGGLFNAMNERSKTPAGRYQGVDHFNVWVEAQSSTLKGDTRYTNTTCFETFPFPQNPSSDVINTIRTAAEDLHTYRSEQMKKKQWSITRLYNEWFHEPSSQLAKLHAKIDRAVMQAYGFKKKDNVLEALLS